jgi:hypothetical protein
MRIATACFAGLAITSTQIMCDEEVVIKFPVPGYDPAFKSFYFSYSLRGKASAMNLMSSPSSEGTGQLKGKGFPPKDASRADSHIS